MREKSDSELLGAFAKEARQRCDVISAGLDTGTGDFETLRQEAHALHGTASTSAGLRRLGELAGLMSPTLPTPPRRARYAQTRASQISEAVEAFTGVKAAADGKRNHPDVGCSLSQLFALSRDESPARNAPRTQASSVSPTVLRQTFTGDGRGAPLGV